MLLHKCPCKPECPERAVGCHGECEKYKQYRAEVDAAARVKRAGNDEYFAMKRRDWLNHDAKRKKRRPDKGGL